MVASSIFKFIVCVCVCDKLISEPVLHVGLACGESSGKLLHNCTSLPLNSYIHDQPVNRMLLYTVSNHNGM